MLSEEYQPYQEYVEVLFLTQPFLEKEQLLANLQMYWPGDAMQTLPALVAAGLVEVSPTGRYRLPLPAWVPCPPGTELTAAAIVSKPLPVGADQVLPRQMATPTKGIEQPVLMAQFKPLRLAVPAVTPSY